MAKPKVDNGHDNQELVLPAIMQGNQATVDIVKELKNDIQRPRNNADLSRYMVMEGMQNEDKVPFFTEFINDDDVLRMNTIEAYAKIVPMIVHKTSDRNRNRIEKLMNDVYIEHVKTHKRNMTSKHRGRELAYTKILANAGQDLNPTSSLATKFSCVSLRSEEH